MTSPTPDAPHGYEEDGITPKAPYGLNVDGTPRKSNRGARPGQRGNGGRATAPTGSRKVAAAISGKTNLTNAKRKEMLCGLADMALVTPLASISVAPFLKSKIGEAQTNALAADAVIVKRFMPEIADGLIVLSETKPGALAWLDSVEDKAPYLLLLQAGLGIAKAVIENHRAPNPELAAAGRTLVRMDMARMADQINAEAAAMGLVPETVAA